MEIKGDEFVKKVQIQQEREELEQKLTELEEVETTISNTNQETIREDSTTMDLNDQELGNIMLENSTSNEENKKKYLVLGLVLVVLFLLTIIIIRLLTDSSTKEDSFTSNKTDPVMTTKNTEDENIEENFQKIMNERIKKDTVIKTDTTSEEKINSIEEAPIKKAIEPAVTEKALDETIKKIEEKKAVEKIKPVVKKTEPKPEVRKTEPKKSIQDLVQSTSSSAPKGYFVQIGAFTKKPSNSYINNIRNAGLKYKIYKVEVKGKLYNKVLIGPYSSRASAKQNIDTIKKKLNLSSAYILKF